MINFLKLDILKKGWRNRRNLLVCGQVWEIDEVEAFIDRLLLAFVLSLIFFLVLLWYKLFKIETFGLTA